MKNLWKTFCLDLGEHETKIIVYVKKEMIQLKDEKKKYIVSKSLLYVQKQI